LLDEDNDLRENQLLAVVQEMGDISERKLQHLVTSHGLVHADQRLPLLEICFPTLKRRPISEIEKILKTIDRLAAADSKIDSFEYLLSRLVRKYLHEAHIPNRTRLHGKRKLSSCIDELTQVVSVVASHGQNSESSAGLQAAQKAFRSGMATANINHTNLSFTDNWQEELDKSIQKLDELRARDKSTVVAALANTVLDDDEVVTAEHEMLRVICALIHVPLPILQQATINKD